jgi:3-deoxy-D-manno-octulosonic acid (KDO) 8-phosphate synthase
VLNVVGDVIDGMHELDKTDGYPVHNDPPRALCDGAQSLTPEQFDDVVKSVNRILEAVR